MICPICGPKDCKEWHICVLHDSKPVCEDCCSACRYRRGYRCGYRREETDHRSEIYKLDRQIKDLEAKADHLYRRSLPARADKLMYKAAMLRREKRGFEHEALQKDRQGAAGDHR